MGPGLGQKPGQIVPDLLAGRVAFQHHMIDQPGFKVLAPAPDVDLDPVALHIRAGREDQRAFRHLAQMPVLAPLVQALPVRGLAAFLPCLAQHRVLQGLQRGLVADRLLPILRDLGPAEPAQRRIEAADVISDDSRRLRPLQHLRLGGRHPCRAIRLVHHLGLVALGDGFITVFADITRRFRPARLPAQAFELQPLQAAAMRTGNMVSLLIRQLVFPLDPREALHGRGRGQKQLAPMPEADRARLGQRDGVALAIEIARIGVDLIEKHPARRHRAQADGAVRAGQDQLPARKPLAEDRVAAVL